MENYCINCANLHSEAKRDPWWKWGCTEWPVEPVRNPVTGEMTMPYGLCRFKNKEGNCADYREGPNIIKPRSKDAETNDISDK